MNRAVSFGVLFVCLISCFQALAQQKSETLLTNADIIKMLKSHVPEATIIDRIRKGPDDFDRHLTELIKLKKARASQSLLQAWEAGSAKESTYPGQYDFRKTAWGMTPDQVRTSESGKPDFDSDNSLGYADQIGNHPVHVFYYFAKGELVRARYAFEDEHSNLNDFIDEFNEVRDSVSEKYGKPGEDSHVWKNDLFPPEHDDPSYWGFAVSEGDLVYHADWDTSATTIDEVLQGDNNHVYLFVDYTSKKLGHLEDEADKEKATSKF